MQCKKKRMPITQKKRNKTPQTTVPNVGVAVVIAVTVEVAEAAEEEEAEVAAFRITIRTNHITKMMDTVVGAADIAVVVVAVEASNRMDIMKTEER